MKEYYELKNRENEFVAALMVEEGDRFILRGREILESQITENNWEEDQSLKNALEILRYTAITIVEGGEVGVVRSDKTEKFLKKNEYKTYTNEKMKITDNRELADKWFEESDVSVSLQTGDDI
jgi:hypothetical protein